MAQQQTQSGATGPGARCPSARELLNSVLKDISDFEAKKLTELKGELEGFVKKQEGLVKDYRTQYPELRRRWCAHQTDIATLYAQLKCTHDPTSDDWKELVKRCICEKRREVYCLAVAIRRRKRCCYGRLERARDRAKAEFDAAKTQLDILVALVQKIEAALGDHTKWITEIKNLAGPERAAILYLFWFRLLPSHRKLMPGDLGTDCEVPGDEVTPEDICKPWWSPCEPEPGACRPADADADAETEATQTGRPVPWLMSPDDYETALDCAWDDYRQAKNALAVAEAAFKNAPDDLGTRIKEHAARKDALEADILACLKEWKPDDPCCGDSPQQQRGVDHA